MRTRIEAVLLAGAVLAAGLGAACSSAATAATRTAKAGTPFTGKAGVTTLKDTATGTVLTCKSSAMSGTMRTPTETTGSIASMSFSTCTGPLNLTITVSPGALPWKVKFSSSTHGKITGIHATLSGPACSAVVDGSKSGADNGAVAVSHSFTADTLKILTGHASLHTYNVSGCAGLIANGNPVTWSAVYKIAAAGG
jgi:hypothetical protein